MRLSDLHVYCLFIAAHSREMIKREWLLDSMTEMSSYSHNVKSESTPKIGSQISVEEAVNEDVKRGQVVCINGTHLGIVISTENMQAIIGVLSEVGKPIYHRLDTFEFRGDLAKQIFGDVKFVSGDIGTITTVGRFLENVIVFQYPTDFKIFGYENVVMSFKKVMKHMTNALSKNIITIEQHRSFVDNFFYLNHISEICVPSLTERSLTTHPDVQKVKEQFIVEHKEQMKDPIVIKELEDKLVALDKEWLGKGTDHPDPSVTFIDGLGSKTWNLHRKKLFLMVGGIPAFDESSGKYDFNPNALVDGWKAEFMPSVANEIRKGSYDRGKETAKGGAETKLVYRVFQDLVIDMDDCKTKRTIKADFKNMFKIEDFIGRTIRDGGVDIILTEENILKYAGKTVDLYSPMTCESPHGLCYKCCGQRCKDLNVRLIGIQVVKITSKFLNTSMKNMHGTVLQTVNTHLSDVLI